MSEQSPMQNANLVKSVETVSDNDVYERAQRLVSDLILPRMAHLHLTEDPYHTPEEHRYTSTAVLYSHKKNVSANVMLYLDLDESRDDSALDSDLGTVMKHGKLGAATLLTNVTFVKGKFEPNDNGYGTYDYFSSLHEDPVGRLETAFATDGSSNIQARLGSGGSDDELSVGTIDTMAIWLRDAEEVTSQSSGR